MGHVQSPIDIKGATASDLPALKFDYKSVPLNIIDNGHTIQINYPAGSSLTVGDKTYALQQIHFHHPSEEIINGHASDIFEGTNEINRLMIVTMLFKRLSKDVDLPKPTGPLSEEAEAIGKLKKVYRILVGSIKDHTEQEVLMMIAEVGQDTPAYPLHSQLTSVFSVTSARQPGQCAGDSRM